MRLQDFPASTLRKFKTPSTWGAIFVYGIFWMALRLMSDLPRGLPLGAELLLPFLMLGGNVALAPLPWLWTGDERKQAQPLRGFLQSLPWNTLWLLALIWPLVAISPLPLEHHRQLHVYILGQHYNLHPVWGLFFFNFPFSLILGWFLADKERAEASERELQVLADRTRAQALQAQLNPHVLFNVLGGLTELVHEDPDAAEEALVGLVAMYRDLTKHGSALLAPLARERALIKHYLNIEEIRLGARLQAEWAWPEWADALELPPLLLQPLVENAIKHGISPSPEGGRLRVELSRGPETLILRVANTGMPLAAEPREGTGLGNLRERLSLMRKFQPSFTLTQEGEWVVAQLNLAWRWPS